MQGLGIFTKAEKKVGPWCRMFIMATKVKALSINSYRVVVLHE